MYFSTSIDQAFLGGSSHLAVDHVSCVMLVRIIVLQLKIQHQLMLDERVSMEMMLKTTCNAKLELLPTNGSVTVIVSLLKPFFNLEN